MYLFLLETNAIDDYNYVAENNGIQDIKEIKYLEEISFQK
jgi:hypothetical protein